MFAPKGTQKQNRGQGLRKKQSAQGRDHGPTRTATLPGSAHFLQRYLGNNHLQAKVILHPVGDDSVQAVERERSTTMGWGHGPGWRAGGARVVEWGGGRKRDPEKAAEEGVLVGGRVVQRGREREAAGGRLAGKRVRRMAGVSSGLGLGVALLGLALAIAAWPTFGLSLAVPSLVVAAIGLVLAVMGAPALIRSAWRWFKKKREYGRMTEEEARAKLRAVHERLSHRMEVRLPTYEFTNIHEAVQDAAAAMLELDRQRAAAKEAYRILRAGQKQAEREAAYEEREEKGWPYGLEVPPEQVSL